MRYNPEYQAFLEELSTVGDQALPAPWKKTYLHVGGIYEVGYAPDSDLLLVVSTAGRGVYNGLTGEKLARDYEAYGDWYQPRKLMAEGIGPLENQFVRIAGLAGGGLPLQTEDGWSLEILLTLQRDDCVVLYEPFVSNTVKQNWTRVYSNYCTFRTAGFSETGRSFVCASSCALVIFSR